METQAFKAAEYEKVSDLVDSARVITDRKLSVYWRGTFPQYFVTDPLPFSASGVAAHAGNLFAADIFLQTLQSDYLILVTYGGAHEEPGGDPATEAQIDSIQRGLLIPQPFSRLAAPDRKRTFVNRFGRELAHPVPIDSLLLRTLWAP